MIKQKYIVNGINNDKIELVSNYDVRKLNRLLDAKDRMWLVKIKQVREQMIDSKFYGKTVATYNDAIEDCVEILDKLIAESEEE